MKSRTKGCRRRLPLLHALNVALAVTTVTYGLLHLHFQLWLDRIHLDNASYMSASLRRPGASAGMQQLSKRPRAVSNHPPSLHTNSTGINSNEMSKAKRNKNNKNPKVPSEFQRQEGVIIVTKIHGPHQWPLLQQSMCLFHHAYNNRVLYDIVVFTAEPVQEEKIKSLQRLVAPSNISLVIDNRGLHEEILALTPQKRKSFLDKCRDHNQLEPSTNEDIILQNLTWFSDCGEGRLAYNWQAEFRSLHIWDHPALKQYNWMLWMDTDAFCTKRWDRDPIAFAIHHNLSLFFDNFPGGGSRALASKIANGFNVSLCKVRVTPQGEFDSILGSVEDAYINPYCNNTQLRSVYGFLHLTNMDFYRSPQVQHGIRTLLGDSFMARDPDDQQAVTIPAAIIFPSKSWDMRRKGIQLDVFHNLHMDGKNSEKVKGFVQLWKTSKLREDIREAQHSCPVTEAM